MPSTNLEMDMVEPSKQAKIKKFIDYNKIEARISIELKDSTDPLTLQKMSDAGGEVLKKKRDQITKEIRKKTH